MMAFIQPELLGVNNCRCLTAYNCGFNVPRMETIGTRLKIARKNARLTQAGLSAKSGITQQMISKLESGQSHQTTGVLSLARACGVSPDWLENGTLPIYADKNLTISEPQPEYGPFISEYRAAPVVGTAQMGADGYWYECDYPVGHGDGYVDVPTKDPNAYSLRVRGQSMAPAIRDGWLVVCEPSREPVPGEYVLVKTTDGRSMVKELLFSKPDGISLMSVNDGYGRINLGWDEVEKIHPVSFIVPPSKLRI